MNIAKGIIDIEGKEIRMRMHREEFLSSFAGREMREEAGETLIEHIELFGIKGIVSVKFGESNHISQISFIPTFSKDWDCGKNPSQIYKIYSDILSKTGLKCSFRSTRNVLYTCKTAWVSITPCWQNRYESAAFVIC